MRVSELTGEKLAYWVAMARGWRLDRPQDRQFVTNAGHLYVVASASSNIPDEHLYRPDINWSQCGELIEKFGIRFWTMQGGGFAACKVTGFSFDGDFIDGPCETGSTPTIAICRAAVASVYGEEVSDEN